MERTLDHIETNLGKYFERQICNDWDYWPTKSIKRWTRITLSLENQLLLTLMRLRLGSLDKALASQFGVHASNISKYLSTWIIYLYLRLGLIPTWPEWEVVESAVLAAFLCTYPTTFCTIDATELRCAKEPVDRSSAYPMTMWSVPLGRWKGAPHLWKYGYAHARWIYQSDFDCVLFAVELFGSTDCRPKLSNSIVISFFFWFIDHWVSLYSLQWGFPASFAQTNKHAC